MTVKKHDGVFYFEAINSNPNGDPDSGNSPRTVRNNIGLVTDICLKRKIRNHVMYTKEGQSGFEIAIRQENDFDETTAVDSLENLMSKYFDFRTFGVVIPKGAASDKKSKKKATDKNSPDHITGPVQFSLSTSVDPVDIVNLSITRMSASGQGQTMGNKKIVSYGLYKFVFNINPFIAKKTGMTDEDVQVILDALVQCWDFDRSSVRAEMYPRALVVFEHENPLGCNSRQLLNLVKVVKNCEESPTKTEDYTITVDESKVPEGVKIRVNQLF